jgi:hypothetical protein
MKFALSNNKRYLTPLVDLRIIKEIRIMMKVKRGLGIFLFILSGINGFSNSTQLSEFVINSVRHNEQLVKNYSVSFSYQFYDSNGKNIIPPKGGNSIISKESFTFVREGKILL